MKLFRPLHICVAYGVVFVVRNSGVFCFRAPDARLTHTLRRSPCHLRSTQLEPSVGIATAVADQASDAKDDLLKDTKEWILSKAGSELASSARFDGNFTDLFPYSKTTRGGTLLEVKDASIWLRDRVLFQNVSFAVNVGECVGIIGNNGVGKSSMFDAIYERLCGLNSPKEAMSVTMRLKFNIREEDVASRGASDDLRLYALLSKLMRSDELTPSRVLELYHSADADAAPTATSSRDLSGVGYMRQNYTLDLDHRAVVADLIGRVFETYSVCNAAVNFVERNLGFFEGLLADAECAKPANEILSLYNREGRLIRRRFSDMRTLIRRLVAIFGMEGVVDATVGSLSGGFKMRLYLFLLLLHSPNLLLLDEPTNNLDTTTVKFLIDALNHLMRNTKLSVLVVSHDASLLNAICTSIIQMSGDGTISPYKGNFDEFVRKGADDRAERTGRIEKLRKKTNALAAEIEELKNRRTGSLKAVRVTLEQKQEALEAMQEELDALVGEPTSKYTKTYTRVLFNKADDFKAIFTKMIRKNELLSTGRRYTNPGPIFRLFDVTLDTDGGKRIFERLSLAVHPADRTVLLGDNGIGKTTLLKLLFKSQATFRNNPVLHGMSSLDRRLMRQAVSADAPDRDSRHWKMFEEVNRVNREMTSAERAVFEADDIEHRILMNEPFNFRMVEGLMSCNDVRLSYYSQNCSNILNYRKRVRDLLTEYVGAAVGGELLAEYMDFFHLGAYLDAHVADLSFGERSRLLLSLLLVNQSHFLLLDEPTNHLDAFMKKLLKLIVNDVYRGGFIVATHDLDFVRDLTTANTFLYIFDRDRVFRFNGAFGPEYLRFKAEWPDADRAKVLGFLTKCAGDRAFAEVRPSAYAEEPGERARRPRTKKKRKEPVQVCKKQPKIKNKHRWK